MLNMLLGSREGRYDAAEDGNKCAERYEENRKGD
jgi:hypothetical protein